MFKTITENQGLAKSGYYTTWCFVAFFIDIYFCQNEVEILKI